MNFEGREFSERRENFPEWGRIEWRMRNAVWVSGKKDLTEKALKMRFGEKEKKISEKKR